MASLPFHVLKHGAQRIPDSAFEKIPYAGPRYFREKEREDRKKRRDRRRRDGRDSGSDPYDSYSDSDYDRSERSSRARRAHRRKERSDRPDEQPDRGYESDQGPQSASQRAYPDAPYFPPPPKIAVNEPEDGQRGMGDENPEIFARPYNPAEYGERPGSRDSYYAGHPQEQQPFAPPPPPGGPAQAPTDPPAGPPYADNDRHSSAADRYRPVNYDQNNRNTSPGSYDQYDNVSPMAQQNRGSPNPTYPSALTVHPQAGYDQYSEYPNPGYNTYPPPYDDDDDEDEEPRQRRHHRHSRSRSRNSTGEGRSRSRIRDATHKAKDGFEKHKKELGVSALGALAGGIIGNEFGGKKGPMGMFIGAALGGIGGGLYERKHEEKKMRKKQERDSRHGSRDGYYSD